MDAWIAYWLHVNPDTLDDEQYVEAWAKVQYLSDELKKSNAKRK